MSDKDYVAKIEVYNSEMLKDSTASELEELGELEGIEYKEMERSYRAADGDEPVAVVTFDDARPGNRPLIGDDMISENIEDTVFDVLEA
ncbi:MAG: hypothetical protein ABEJ83_00825 [Candidatus Nanohaloarchaea archaeon]